MARRAERDLEARKKDLRAISSQVREIGLRLNKELQQNRFWKSKSERELRSFNSGRSNSLTTTSRQDDSGKAGARAEFHGIHKENITPAKAVPSPSPKKASNRAGPGTQLVLKEEHGEQLALGPMGGGGGALAASLESDKIDHYEEAMRLLNERLEDEVASHMDTHLELEALKERALGFEEVEAKANKRVDALLSEMDVLRAKQHTRENEFVANIIKHQNFLQEERQKRFQVEKELHKALRRVTGLRREAGKETEEGRALEERCLVLAEENEGLRERLASVSLSARASEEKAEALSRDLSEAQREAEKRSQEAFEALQREKEEALAKLAEVTERLEEAVEVGRVHKEEAETKDVHCTFLQDQLDLAEASLTEREEELEKLKQRAVNMEALRSESVDFVQVNEQVIHELEQKQEIVSRLEEELMQKDGTINLLKETFEMYKKNQQDN